jgi:hypothetical protein
MILTPYGEVSVISKYEAPPEGWRVLTMTEGKEIKEHLGNIIGYETKVAFKEGSLDGHGYGHQFHEEAGDDVFEVFIIKE